MKPDDAFAILGLSITASEREAKAAYRRLVALYHPDRTDQEPALAAERMRRVNDAYATARGGWHRTASRAEKPIYAPPKPPPRPKGPQPPPVHEEALRSAAAVAAEHARRDALVEDLSRIAFIGHDVDARRSHPVVDAFLPLIPAGASLRACRRYDAMQVAGERIVPRRLHHFLHAVPSLAQGEGRPRADAIDRIVTAEVVACTDDLLLWSVSRLADGDDGILLREDIDAYAAPFDEIRTVQQTHEGVEVILARGAALKFVLAHEAAEDLAAHLIAAA